MVGYGHSLVREEFASQWQRAALPDRRASAGRKRWCYAGRRRALHNFTAVRVTNVVQRPNRRYGGQFSEFFSRKREFSGSVSMAWGGSARRRSGAGRGGGWGLCVAAVAGCRAAGRFRRLGFGARGRAAVAPIAVLATRHTCAHMRTCACTQPDRPLHTRRRDITEKTHTCTHMQQTYAHTVAYIHTYTHEHTQTHKRTCAHTHI
jgi:hypothetical protein